MLQGFLLPARALDMALALEPSASCMCFACRLMGSSKQGYNFEDSIGFRVAINRTISRITILTTHINGLIPHTFTYPSP